MTMLEQLQNIDPAQLLEVVRQDQQSPDFTIEHWSVQRLSDKGAINPDGLYCFSGNGSDKRGRRDWSVVLKILKDPGDNADPSYTWYWKREVLAYQSGLLTGLPGPLKAARSYGVKENERNAWLWMELLTDKYGGQWGKDQHALAAYQLGRLNGAYASETPLPNYPWLCKGQAQSWTIVQSPEPFWDNAAVLQYCSGECLRRIRQLWADREQFCNVLELLPQAFSHFDYKRRNLFIRERPDGSDEVVAIDWAECGVGALGRDLAFVVGSNAASLEWNPSDTVEIERECFNSYLTGLQDAGWQGDHRMVRLGYTAWVALKVGIIFPKFVAGFLSSTQARANAERFFGYPADQLADAWMTLGDLVLDRGDESRSLMKELGFG